MAEELVGAIVLVVNGDDVDCASVNVSNAAGRKLVSTMNRSGRANKSAKTTKSTTLSVEVYVPEEGDLDWASISDATLTVESFDGQKRTTYTGCGVTTVGEKYTDGSEAMRSLEIFAKDVIEE
jgi:hypothetical protein